MECVFGSSRMSVDEICVPMESNPDTMSKYLHKLGVPDKWRMVDVMGLDSDALAYVPRPVLAVILLFPLSDVYEKERQQQESELTKKTQDDHKEVFHLKQVMSNVCGTVALVHSVANNIHHINLHDGMLKKYIEDAKEMDSADRGALLENSKAILGAYKDLLRSTGGVGVSEEEPVTNHFVTFVQKDGKLFELDGRKQFPVYHGPTSPETFLEDAAKICRQFIDREKDNINFNVVALVQAS